MYFIENILKNINNYFFITDFSNINTGIKNQDTGYRLQDLNYRIIYQIKYRNLTFLNNEVL